MKPSFEILRQLNYFDHTSSTTQHRNTKSKGGKENTQTIADEIQRKLKRIDYLVHRLAMSG